MSDLVALNGPWQVITFLNFYKVEYDKRKIPTCTVILYEINDELKGVCKSILSIYNFVEQIVDLKEIKDIEKESYNNLWIGKLFSLESKNIADSFSYLPIILFEEGVHSYIESKYLTLFNVVWASNSLKKKLKVAYNYFFKNELLKIQFSQFVLLKHKKRCKKIYYLLPLKEKGNTKNSISTKYIFSILEDSKSILQPNFILVKDRPCVLVIGQYFSELGLLSYSDELGIYNRILENYFKKGYEVYWKGHPRSKMFDVRIKELHKHVNILKNNSIPLEIFLISNPGIELCGISSSVLLYNSVLFNGKSKQCLSLAENYWNKNSIWYKDFFKIFSLINQNVSSMDI